MNRTFLNREGVIRIGWLLVATVCLYLAADAGSYGLNWSLWRMMNVWGVTDRNIHQAHGAVRFMYNWANVLTTLVRNALLIVAGKGLLGIAGFRNEDSARQVRKAGVGAGLGAAGIALIGGVLLLSGSCRLGWRLTNPQLSINALALLLTALASSLGEGCYLYGAVLRTMQKRLPIWAARGIVMLFSTLTAGSFSPVGLLNGVLTALALCLLAERLGTGEVVGFRLAWRYLEQAVFGFAGATAALYEIYPVNLYWLNGGNAGITNGIAVTILMGGLSAWLLRGEIVCFTTKRSKSPS